MKTLKLHKVDDSFQAFLVEGSSFTDEEEYPILPEKMVTKNCPVKILPFNKALNYRGDLSDTFVCTYAPDKSFERLRRNPQLYVDFFKRTAGIIGFDFSVHSDMPIVKQKAQMYDNLALTYYFGKNDIEIIPNIRCGSEELLPEYLKAFPRHTLVSVGTNGFIKTYPEKCEWLCFLETVIRELEPTGIVVYGSLNGELFDEIKKDTPVYIYDSWISSRSKEVRNHVN